VSGAAHIIAGFTEGWRRRRELRRLLDTTPGDTSLLALDPQQLRQSGICAVALDFDGVLAHHGAPTPSAAATEWLRRCETVFGGDQMFILSNKPTEERRQWFAEHFPSLRFIAGVRKKPYPDGLIQTGELSGAPLQSILMVDDRLLTGCLAALCGGAVPCYIRRPVLSFRYRPFAELFFLTLRCAERWFVRATTII
jgi:predicted HAD superfamily phosphohydrolase YqeG